MSKSLDEYLELDKQLTYARIKHLGRSSVEEDNILAKMDKVWEKLTRDEMDSISNNPFNEPSYKADTMMEDVAVEIGKSIPVRRKR